MKKITLYLLLLFVVNLTAQVTNQGQPMSWKFNQLNNVIPIQMPAVDLESLQAEDAINDLQRNIPWRFGTELPVNLTMQTSGTWDQLPNGDRIWRLNIVSEGAKTLNFVFSDFFLPTGASLYFYNNERSDLLGAYTSSQNREDRQLGTWFVEGDNIWIEYYEPRAETGKGSLQISRVVHGYRSVSQTQIAGKALNDSGPCNHDVDCPVGEDFDSLKNVLKRSVALFILGGSVCSGTLINNTDNNNAPYFLTANHCDNGNTAVWAFRFNWVSPDPSCGTTTNSANGNYNQTTSGATKLANNSKSDVMLVNIDGNLPSAWNLTWAGWNRSDTDIPAFTVGIHHPAGDIMKVCRVTSPFINSLPEFTFQEKIPVANVEYTIEIPEYLNYRAYSKGFFPLKQTKTSRREKLLISYRADTDPQVGGLGNINSLRTERGQIEFNLETTVYSVTQLPKLVEEEYVNNMDNYLNSIKHELEWTKMPGSSLETYTHSWDDVAKSIYKHSRFGNEIDTREYFEQDLDPLLKTAQNSFEKIKIVFDFVKQKVKWNEKYGVLVKDGVKKAYSQRTGNVAEINLMLTGMLRYAGLNANPILVSTRANGIAYFPTREGFNYVIAAVELNNELILLDATNEFTEPNILTEKTLNWVGRLIRSDFSSVEVDLMPKILSKRVFDLNIKMDLQGTINGRCRNSYTNHEALNYRNNFAGKSDKAYEEIIENNYSLMEISDIDITNRKETDKPYIENFNFNKTSSFDALGDRIYFQPLFFMATTKNPFKAEEREFPIDFSFPRSKIVRLQIEIPEGYKIESAPESATYKLPDDLGEFTYLISTTENTINLRVISEIKASILPAGYYSALKEYYKLVVEKETEKIVLVKS